MEKTPAPPAAPATQPDATRRRSRADGWTKQRQQNFLKSLALTGSVQRAAKAVGMSASSAYRLRLHPDAARFRYAWSCALVACASALRQIAFDRAINGTLEDVIQNGACVGTRIVHNDRLLMFLLREYGNQDANSVQGNLASSLGGLVDIDDPEAQTEAEAQSARFNNAGMSGELV
jgi:hypothetical protein